MMEPRLRAELLVTALRRHAEAAGGFGVVLARGDSAAGAILAVIAEKGRKARVLERVLDMDGGYKWRDVSSEAVRNDEQTTLFLARRRKNDPDLWLIELDVPSAERFTSELNESV